MSASTNKTDAAPPRQIRFVHNQGQPPSKRRRINAACLTCRRRKTRCAGERPLCSTCTKNGHRCLGYPEEIKREDGGGPDGNVFEARQDDDDDAIDDDDHQHSQEADDRTAATRASVAAAAPALDSKTTKARANKTDIKPVDVYLSPQQTNNEAAPGHSLAVDDAPDSPSLRRAHNHRIPYFRYFGPTAIVPGFKQMVVSVRDRRRSTGGSHSGTSPMSTPGNLRACSSAGGSDVILEDLPTYDPNDAAPVHPLIISLVKAFFLHVGCNYPFLKQGKFLRLVKEKRVEPILVDAVCALAARFSDAPPLCGSNDKMPRTERGHIFAQRAKLATVDTFPAPSVAAVQACLLMAYEGFGANQDSALWMYLGLAIRMAVDLGLQKRVGIRYQGEKDPGNTRKRSRKVGDSDSLSPEDKKREDTDALSLEEQREVEQERIDTFWAVFVLDRVISSGTGRPVTFRDGDFDLAFPDPTIDPSTGWPAPFPIFLEIIHLYGRVCDVLNNVHNIQDLTQETWDKLTKMEHHLTRLYKGWDARLQFNVSNFKAYLNIGQGTTFILLHFWFHALFIILHQPTLMSPFGELRSELQLLSDSRELSMSSAKTICDILAFADLIDPKSFIGNPFTSQPIYIAACAFLMESSASASEAPSREGSPPSTLRARERTRAANAKHSRHSLLASAANQNYQRCYNSLQLLHTYWGGVKYILTALDQKSKGIWDCETYTSEEYESTKMERRGSAIAGQFPRFDHASPKPAGPPIAWSLAGTANSPSSSLTLMYQSGGGAAAAAAAPVPSTPPGNMVFDPIRPEAGAGAMFPPAAFPQPQTSALGSSPRRPKPRRLSSLASVVQAQPALKFDGLSEAPGYVPSRGAYDAYALSPTGTMPEGSANAARPVVNGGAANAYYPGMAFQQPWPGGGVGNMDGITFDSQDIDIGALGLQQPDLMNGWLDYLAGDVLGLFENQEMGGPSGP